MYLSRPNPTSTLCQSLPSLQAVNHELSILLHSPTKTEDTHTFPFNRTADPTRAHQQRPRMDSKRGESAGCRSEFEWEECAFSGLSSSFSFKLETNQPNESKDTPRRQPYITLHPLQPSTGSTQSAGVDSGSLLSEIREQEGLFMSIQRVMGLLGRRINGL